MTVHSLITLHYLIEMQFSNDNVIYNLKRPIHTYTQVREGARTLMLTLMSALTLQCNSHSELCKSNHFFSRRFEFYTLESGKYTLENIRFRLELRLGVRRITYVCFSVDIRRDSYALLIRINLTPLDLTYLCLS